MRNPSNLPKAKTITWPSQDLKPTILPFKKKQMRKLNEMVNDLIEK